MVVCSLLTVPFNANERKVVHELATLFKACDDIGQHALAFFDDAQKQRFIFVDDSIAMFIVTEYNIVATV